MKGGLALRSMRVGLVVLFSTLALGCGRAPVPAACAGAVAIGQSVAIPAGTLGAPPASSYPEEAQGPQGPVGAFEIDATEVTNQQFEAFVAATGYVTVAERMTASGRNGAAVFSGETALWRLDPAADWRHPLGAGSSIEGRGTEPVVGVAYEDAEAYARWAGRRLPTEAEWTLAAQTAQSEQTGRLDQEAIGPDGTPLANIWMGIFPVHDTLDDGYRGVAPVGCYPPNPHGLYDMIGNVWEWTDTPFGPGQHTIKGGSYLCAENFCKRYRSAARQGQDVDFSSNHIGIRIVRDLPAG